MSLLRDRVMRNPAKAARSGLLGLVDRRAHHELDLGILQDLLLRASFV